MKLPRMNKIRIGVVGDLIFDHFIIGKVERISPEAPVPIVKVTNEYSFLGGASNVARNLKSIGIDVALFGVVGSDITGKKLIDMVKAEGIESDYLIVDKHRSTTIKTRVIAHSQQVVRFDKEEITRIKQEMVDKIIENVKHASLDALIISDYGKGVITRELIEGLTSMNGLFISADPKVKNAKYYRDVNLITPNLKEAEEMSRIDVTGLKNGLKLAANVILKDSNAEYVLITQGEKGMTLFSRDGTSFYQKAKAKEVYDVTGAGDTVVATVTAFFIHGFDIKDAVRVANVAAGIVVGKAGTATVTLEELEKELDL